VTLVSCSVMLTTVLMSLMMMTSSVTACNEAVCASIVSKCMLLQSCKCELHPDCTCCKKCFECLDYLYSECCSCVDLCPKPNVTIHELSKKSSVEDLDGGTPTLFQALTDQDDAQGRWSIVTFPVDIDMTSFLPSINIPMKTLESGEESINSLETDLNKVTVNCSVAYMSQCMSWNKCKASCTSMGASSYRWFHDGCCECVGSQCINYGINQSRCSDCPLLDEEDEEMERLINMDFKEFEELENELEKEKSEVIPKAEKV